MRFIFEEEARIFYVTKVNLLLILVSACILLFLS